MAAIEMPVVAPETVGLSSAGLAAMDAAIQAHIDRGTIAGAVMIVARHGQVCHEVALGKRDIASDAPAAIDDLFRIFSMTKPVTAAAMLVLWDEGRWTLDDPIVQHLPEFADLQVFAGLNPDGSMRLEPPHRAPTLRDLFTHTAGFSYGTRLSDPGDPVDAAYQAAGVWDTDTLTEMMARLARVPLAYQPGTSWKYSLGMDVQGAMIERMTGQTFATFLAERVFEPLGLRDTRFYTPPSEQHRLATLYLNAPDSPLTSIPNPMFKDATSKPMRPLGGAGLVSTAGDYARFAAMLLGRRSLAGVSILSKRAVALMTRNLLPDSLIEHGFVMGHQRIGPGRGFGLNGSVFTDPRLAGASLGVGTYQWDGAAGTWFWVDPANDLLMVGMTQTLSYTAPPLQAQTQSLLWTALDEASMGPEPSSARISTAG